MNQANIYDKLREIFSAEFDIAPEKVVASARLYEDLDIDSIDAVNLLALMYKTTGKRMSPDDFRDIRTVGDLVAVLEKQMSE